MHVGIKAPTRLRNFFTSPYGLPTRGQFLASVNNWLTSVNNSSQLAETLKDLLTVETNF